ncbi:MAG: tyrosine-type recombinase/integrase [Flavobacteriaceae bacterium]|nr:tyrosine-type recombinase/integrase [Flavobacteriaceae bacterium]
MIPRFLEYLEVEKRYSPNTITSYRKDLEDFSLFLLSTENQQDLRQVDKKIVRNFLISLNEKEFSKRSINRKISTLKSFYLFLLKISEIKTSPLENISTLKFYPEKQTPFSSEELQNLGDILQQENTPLLDKLILETLYQTGMRRAEICSLLLENVDFSKNEITIIGKGNKERIMPISLPLTQELKNYADKHRQASISAKKYFFVSPKGKKITEKFVYLITNYYLSLVSLKKKRSPHILRHSFATHILNNGAEISKVKKLMGHSSLASTQVYTNANIEQLKSIFKKAHPRSKKE